MTKKTSKQNIYTCVQALHQAAANAFHGALDKEGEPREDMPIGDANSGFNISIAGNTVNVKYQEEFPLSRVKKTSFEGDVRQKMADILSFLKKEYKAISGESLKTKNLSKVEMMVQSLSRFRSWVNASQTFELTDLDKDSKVKLPEEKREETLEEAYQRFLSENAE